LKIGLLLIATGERYRGYVRPMVESARVWFAKSNWFVQNEIETDIILWTDEIGAVDYHVDTIIKTEYHGYPDSTLYRYHMFHEAKEILSEYDWLFYADVDSVFVGPVDAIFVPGLVGCTHPSFVGGRGTPEENPNSMAFLQFPRVYFCGGFVGGSTKEFLWMSQIIKGMVDTDKENGIRAKWNDESYLNRYLYDNPPALILDPGYCYPSPNNLDWHRRIWQNPALGWPGDYRPRMQIIEKNLTVEQKEKL